MLVLEIDMSVGMRRTPGTGLDGPNEAADSALVPTLALGELTCEEVRASLEEEDEDGKADLRRGDRVRLRS